MFRLLSFFGLILTFGWLVYALRSKSIGLRTVGSGILQAGQGIIMSFRHLKSLSHKDFADRLLFPLIQVCILILALTSFLPIIILGKHMSGYLLILHVAIGPLFALCMVTMGILWAHKHLLDMNDWKVLRDLLSKNSRHQKGRSIDLGKKVCFWFIVLLAFPILFSIVSGMYKIFGTHGQEFLLQLHRYAALLFVILMAVYTDLVKLRRV